MHHLGAPTERVPQQELPVRAAGEQAVPSRQVEDVAHPSLVLGQDGGLRPRGVEDPARPIVERDRDVVPGGGDGQRVDGRTRCGDGPEEVTREAPEADAPRAIGRRHPRAVERELQGADGRAGALEFLLRAADGVDDA
jgi:hypothetical protein